MEIKELNLREPGLNDLGVLVSYKNFKLYLVFYLDSLIFYELIHAELYIAIFHKKGSPIDKNFEANFEKYVKLYRGDTEIQHNYMAENMVSKMASVLFQIHSHLGKQSFLNDPNVKAAFPKGLPSDFYHGIAWSGLKWTDKWRYNLPSRNSYINYQKLQMKTLLMSATKLSVRYSCAFVIFLLCCCSTENDQLKNGFDPKKNQAEELVLIFNRNNPITNFTSRSLEPKESFFFKREDFDPPFEDPNLHISVFHGLDQGKKTILRKELDEMEVWFDSEMGYLDWFHLNFEKYYIIYQDEYLVKESLNPDFEFTAYEVKISTGGIE